MSSQDIRMVVGLGNPGKSYAKTRHNAGFWVVDSLSKLLGIEVRRKKFGGKFGEAEFAGKKLILLKPMQYMNCSGQVVATASGFYKLSISNVLVISDEMSLKAGRIRVRARGSAGGHKGLADIIEKLGSDAFCRLRIGIGQSGQMAAEDYVLSEPAREERSLLDESVERSLKAVICWLEEGIETVMNRFNPN